MNLTKTDHMKATFRIQYDTIWGETLCLTINDKKYPMNWEEDNYWTVTLPRCSKADLSDYSYLVIKDGTIRRTEWEHHSFTPQSTSAVTIEDSWIDCPIEGCSFTRKHTAEIFDRPGFRGAGTVIPIFSLRSGDDFGIGEFSDLRPLVDWAASTGQCMIQLLPVNDTTRKGGWEDSYPYSPISSFALHPLYINLSSAGVKKDQEYLSMQKELNALDDIDYPRVFKEKMRLLRDTYIKIGHKTLNSREYKRFYKENAFWLDEYSTFCAKRDSLEPEYYNWIQFHLDKQFSEEVAYAHSKGVYFKGDLPIGVSRDSADAHYHPELFNLDSNAGAPPDFFSAEGQNWGFPTYNWEAMAKDDYNWWKSRLRQMSKYFSAFRIDHILGFFRIWEIPAEYNGGQMGHFNPALPYSTQELEAMHLPTEGLFLADPRNEGYWQPMISPTGKDNLEEWQRNRFDALYNDFFYHRHNGFWKTNAEKKLPELLSATGMLACGEDLGMVPDSVPEVMDHERILSLEMPFVDKHRPWPYLSVCTTSSHDMETLRMQSANDRTPEECNNIISNLLGSISMLAILPLQDWLSIDGDIRRKDYKEERINNPANPNHHWRYRLHIEVEKLSLMKDFNTRIRNMIQSSGRYPSGTEVSCST